MTEAERTSIKEQLIDLFKWMNESSGKDLPNSDINDLIKDSGDIYEVFVIIHLINGEKISLQNRCFESFVKKRYAGDFINCPVEKPDEDDYIELIYRDMSDNDILHQCRIPISSICYIEGYDIDLNWSNLYNYLFKRLNRDELYNLFSPDID